MHEWPAIPPDAWKRTSATLHMWTQMVGKLCLATTAPVNHFWNIAFRVTSRGLSTPTLYAGDTALVATFDFIDHQLVLQRSAGASERVPLEPRTVASFYAAFLDALARLDVHVRLWPMPVEIPDPIRFTDDTVHHDYDPDAAHALWQTLLAITPVFERFRSGFIGKCSPVHFFWGSFDLAVTRFSGRRAPDRPGADRITREAYSHEVISHGFWPGSGAVPDPAFYAYAAPEPAGFRDAPMMPDGVFYSPEFSIFILPYDIVRRSPSPDQTLTAFLESTYNTAARLAGWNRPELERS